MEAWIGSEPTIVFAFWLGVAVAAMSLLTLLVVIVMRQLMLRRERIHADAAAFWHIILSDATGARTAKIPSLSNREIPGFLQAWNEVHDGLSGATTPRLAMIARETGLEKRMQARLAHGGFHRQLVAVIAMGNIQSSDSFVAIEKFIDDKNSILSLCAARALMQIDAGRASEQFVHQITQRGDWSQGSIAAILQEAGADNVSRQLFEATLQANADIAQRLVRFLAGVSPEAAAPIIRSALLSSPDERLISTCLQIMSRREDLDCVRPLLVHPRWHVRMQASVTLGRLGVPGDERLLAVALSDPQWWVRYRAAQALTHLSFIGDDDMRRIEQAQSDHYASDIIKHVLAEKIMETA